MNFKCLFCGALITLYVGVAEAVNYVPENISASISLKVPGNVAERYSLNLQQLGNNRSSYLLEASESIPVTITQGGRCKWKITGKCLYNSTRRYLF